jgi:hypothetical protein
MDREQLEAWLKGGLSLEQIGALVERDPSTVGYWCVKHGLVPNGSVKHSAKGALRRDDLEPLVEAGLSIREIAAELGRSPTTVRHWLRRHGFPPRRRRPRAGPDAPMKIADVCRKHGSSTFVLEGSGYYRCAVCRVDAVTSARRRNKERLVADLGGRCERCGYDRHLAALQFHHRDRADKAFTISRYGSAAPFAELKREAEKCVLLCANCHAEVEWGGASLTDLR